MALLRREFNNQNRIYNSTPENKCGVQTYDCAPKKKRSSAIPGNISTRLNGHSVAITLFNSKIITTFRNMIRFYPLPGRRQNRYMIGRYHSSNTISV